MKSDTKYSLKFITGSILILLILSTWSLNRRKNSGSAIKGNTEYAIGQFDKYSVSGGTYAITSYSVRISFYASKKYMYTGSKGKIGEVEKAKKGDRFLVIYDRLEPENCQILFDYPIKDSSDFKRYLEEFKVNPLDIDKYF